MLRTLLERIRQGHRTMAWPDGAPPEMADRYLGLPVLDPARCAAGRENCATACATACPTDAFGISPDPAAGRLTLDVGRCLFCGDCAEACPTGAVAFSREFRMATRGRDHLVLGQQELQLAEALDARTRRLFGRSLKLRQVSAGGCNACEADAAVLGTVGFDMGRFGIQFVASPRHADGLLITGPVTANMRLALEKTYQAVPAPKIVIAVGACAISGGPYIGHPEASGGAAGVVPVDLFIPGCPPHPMTVLDGLLRLLGRIGDRVAPS